jgi:hypothetical protein
MPIPPGTTLSAFLAEIDDWCGTRPPRKFPPRPKGLRDAMIAVAIHTLAGQVSNSKVRGQLQGLASELHAQSGLG